jgi:type I restriction enzyme, S subunit
MSEVVPEGWEKSSIDELLTPNCLFSDGDWVESKDQDPNGTNRLIQLADIGDGKFLNKSNRFMNDEQFERLNCTELKQGDILVARMPDPIGRASIFPKTLHRSATVVDVAVLRPTAVDNYWLMSVINSSEFRKEIEENATGTTRTRIGRTALSNITIPIPPLPEQKKIASILTSVDEVIEKTQSQIDKLQDLKKGTMNELLTKGIGHTEFKDSELGRIPKSWEVRSLDQISTFRRGSFPQPYGRPEWYSENGHPFVQVFDISHNNELKSSTKVRISDAAAEQSVFIPKGSLIVSLQGSIGRTAITQYDAYVDRTILIFLKYEDKLELNFFSTIIKELFRKQKEVADGGIIKTITKETLRDFKITIPPLEEQTDISKVLGAIQSSINNTFRKLESTQSLKKSLMQDLLTGKVRVSVN